eukprot:CAMPEP_0168336268 /NCGR_PEP_ID=MMETSP0213-20121227/11434_1 /TAXON_ID=151035 /ORGANISM="Euplotes harpa, Strain FSP1.4" /LENGTH=107 /DNA_ID=CAMNT_0008341415 /DNA_START=63 /DNA_END=383 /DNA_ORIENTATION=-
MENICVECQYKLKNGKVPLRANEEEKIEPLKNSSKKTEDVKMEDASSKPSKTKDSNDETNMDCEDIVEKSKQMLGISNKSENAKKPAKEKSDSTGQKKPNLNVKYDW